GKHGPCAGEIVVDDTLPIRTLGFEDECIAQNRRIVDHDVESAEALDGERHRIGRSAGRGDIRGKRHRLLAQALGDTLSDGWIRCIAGDRYARIGYYDPRTTRAQFFADGQSDA